MILKVILYLEYSITMIFQLIVFLKSDNRYIINPYNLSFTTEVKNKNNDVLFIDGNCRLNSISVKNKKITNHKMTKPTPLPYAIDYNISSKYIYGNQKDSHSMYSFYFYSPDSGLYWIRPADKIKKICNDPLICSNNLCINEHKNTLVVAYLDNKLYIFIQSGWS